MTDRRASEIYRRETGTGWDVRRRILSHARVIVNRCLRWNTAQTDDGTVASASAMGVAAMMLVPIIILIVKDLQKPSAENEASSCVTRWASFFPGGVECQRSGLSSAPNRNLLRC
jgi:hypothetical protein